MLVFPLKLDKQVILNYIYICNEKGGKHVPVACVYEKVVEYLLVI